MHFVIIRLSALGDIILLSGVLSYLHTHYGFTFTLITREQFAPLFERHPAVQNVEVLPNRIVLWKLLTFAWSMAKKYSNSLLLDFHGTIRTKIIRAMWRAPAFVYPKFSSERKAFLRYRDVQAQNILSSVSVPQRYLLCVKKYIPPMQNSMPTAVALAPRLYATESEYGMVVQKFIPPQKCIAIHPYATHATKMWAQAYWEELLVLLSERSYPVIILGRSVKVFTSPHVPLEHNYTNRTSLRESMGLLHHADILITGDSGLMHLATAVGTPSIALFGPTTKEWGFFPPSPSVVLEDATLQCRPCSLHGKEPCPFSMECMANIEPRAVMNALNNFIDC